MKPLPSFGVPLAVALLLLPAPTGDLQPPPRPPGALGVTAPDGEPGLRRLSGLGRFAEVLEEGRTRLQSGPRTCLLAELTADAAERRERLPQLLEDLETQRKANPNDPILLVAQGLALRLHKNFWRARNILARAIHLGTVCHQAYETFLELSHEQGRLRDARGALVQLRAARPQDPYVLLAVARSWDLQGEVSRALRSYQEALLEAPALAITYRHHARLLNNVGQYQRAAHASKTGARLALGLAQPEQATYLLAAEGAGLEGLGRHQEADRALERALEVARESHLFALESRVLIEMSILSAAWGRRDASSDYLAQAQSLEDRVYLPRDRIRYLIRLGDAKAGLGEYPSATAALSEGLALAQSRGDTVMESEARLHLAAHLLASGDMSAAQLFRESYEQAVARKDTQNRRRALSGLGGAYERMGSYTPSLDYYQRALELARRSGDRHAAAIAMGNVGLLYFRLNQPSQAFLYSARSAQLARELSDVRLEASLLNGLAASLAGLGRLEQSQQVYRRALQAASPIDLPALEGSILAGWARVTLARGGTAEARQGFERALDAAARANDPLIRVQALYGLGQSHAREGSLELATAQLEKALGVVESTRGHIPTPAERMSYLETRTDIYSSLAMTLLDRDDTRPGSGFREEAFRVVERSRARALLELILISRQAMDSSADGPTPRATDMVDSHEVRAQVLEPGEVFLEYTLGEPRSVLWVLTREDFRVLALPARHDIESIAGTFLRALRTPPRVPQNPFERHLAPARELFTMLLGPVADLLHDQPHVIIAADGILHHLPFEALAAEDSGYLAELATVSYVPSASVLASLRRRPYPKGHRLDFLGVAQPEGAILGDAAPDWLELDQLPPIPYASVEIERVAEIFPEPRRLVRLGPDANEAAVKATPLGDFRILHFAAHAMTDETFPARSAILLGGRSDREDGLLRMDEVSSLNLSADLVVLSGCRTGVGQLLRAEGVLGFTWAFLSAGSAAIVASRWSVNDRSTATLMEAFYSEMSQGLSPAGALRAAKLRMLGSERTAYRHPYYWAPFVLVGVGNRPSEAS